MKDPMLFYAIIGWAGAIPIILILRFLLRRKLNSAKINLLLLALYLLSLGTGIFFSKGLQGYELQSAYIAGIYAPLIYSTIAYLYFKNRVLHKDEDEEILDR